MKLQNNLMLVEVQNFIPGDNRMQIDEEYLNEKMIDCDSLCLCEMLNFQDYLLRAREIYGVDKAVRDYNISYSTFLL